MFAERNVTSVPQYHKACPIGTLNDNKYSKTTDYCVAKTENKRNKLKPTTDSKFNDREVKSVRETVYGVFLPLFK